MTGCLPQDSSHQPPHALYSLASDSHLEGTTSAHHPRDSHQLYSGHSSPSISHPAHRQQGSSQQRPYRTDSSVSQAIGVTVSANPTLVQPSYHQHHQQSVIRVQQPQPQQIGQPAHTVTSHQLYPSPSGSDHFAQFPDTSGPQYSKASESQGQQHHLGHTAQTSFSQRQQSVALSQQVATHRQPPGQFKAGVSQYQPPVKHHHHYKPVEQQQYRHPTETVTLQSHYSRPADRAAHQQQSGRPSEVSTLHLPSSFAGPSPHTTASFLSVSTACPQYLSQQSEALESSHPSSSQQEHHPQAVTTSLHQQSYQRSPPPSTMLDKKPSLQIVTDHSPVSPGSSTSSPRFIYPDMQTLSPGHLASDSGSSPFMLPIKQEVKWEVGTPPQSSDLEPVMHQAHRERYYMFTGSAEASETLADSETGSSVLEDSSSSSREQSPFSTMAESLSLRSPSELPLSPLARKTHQAVVIASEDEDLGEEGEGGSGMHTSTLSRDTEFHPSKFKRRLHDRYMLSLKDTSEIPCKIKEESVESYEAFDVEAYPDPKRPIPKLERPDSPGYLESPMPKSPRRSSSDTDMAHAESTEMGTTSADEGDVFMEPTMIGRTKPKPPSLHQREPLDLSRGPLYPGFRSSSGSSPLLDPEHLSPASKIFSPVFRSPHRLPYSPHGLLSPQSQSPLCSVPEGGRIFNFNVPSPLEGAHSDSDLISPSPMSPRIFTFPPHGSLLNPMSEVNRLAVSPRAPYTPPPSFMRGKHFVGVAHSSKWGDERGFCSKRSLSESDMTYMCPVCGQAFPSNDSLAKHMAKHLPTETVRSGDNKIHYCKVCNRCFSRSDMLTRHMRLHTGLKPYECMDCGQVFSRSDHLNTHRRTHTGEKPYRCPHCPYAACRRDMITRHMRTHAKRTSRRSRYLSVPDEGDAHKPSGSVSSTDRTDSQDFSVGCSVSSVDSVESESVHSSRPPYLGTSVDSLLSPDQDQLSLGPHSSPSSRKLSEEGMEGEVGLEGGSSYDRFMRYRKARNWSTTSLESVDSEEAVVIREVLVDDAFLDTDPQPTAQAAGVGGDFEAARRRSATSSSNPTDLVGLEANTLQKCFISSQPPGNSGS